MAHLSLLGGRGGGRPRVEAEGQQRLLAEKEASPLVILPLVVVAVVGLQLVEEAEGAVAARAGLQGHLDGERGRRRRGSVEEVPCPWRRGRRRGDAP
jgi:hypothetical protein